MVINLFVWCATQSLVLPHILCRVVSRPYVLPCILGLFLTTIHLLLILLRVFISIGVTCYSFIAGVQCSFIGIWVPWNFSWVCSLHPIMLLDRYHYSQI